MEWTTKELELLKEEYKKHTPAEDIAILLHRTVRAVRNKAWRLNITDTSDNWTEEQIKFLKENYSQYTLKEIAKILGNRNASNIKRKAKELGITYNWPRTMHPKSWKDEFNHRHPVGWKRKTKEEIGQKRSEIMKEWHKTHEHPRGMLGKKQSEETRKKFSDRMVRDWKNENSVYNSEAFRQLKSDLLFQKRLNNRNSIDNYSRARSGKREDLDNKFFRSSWEANYARYLNFLIKKKQLYKWEYEPDVFIFEQVKRGIRSYTPDFKLWDTKNSEPYYVEIKGWMDDKSKVKLNRMTKYYPEVKIRLFQKEDYKELKNKLGRMIENWED